MITVIDSPCGTGKTSWAIQEMNKNLDKKYIFITPFLDEIEINSGRYPISFS